MKKTLNLWKWIHTIAAWTWFPNSFALLINNLAVIIATHILNPLSFFNNPEMTKPQAWIWFKPYQKQNHCLFWSTTPMKKTLILEKGFILLLWISQSWFPYNFTVSINTQATTIIIITHILNPPSFFINLEIDKSLSMNLAHTLLETKSHNKPLSVLIIYHTHEGNPNAWKRVVMKREGEEEIELPWEFVNKELDWFSTQQKHFVHKGYRRSIPIQLWIHGHDPFVPTENPFFVFCIQNTFPSRQEEEEEVYQRFEISVKALWNLVYISLSVLLYLRLSRVLQTCDFFFNIFEQNTKSHQHPIAWGTLLLFLFLFSFCWVFDFSKILQMAKSGGTHLIVWRRFAEIVN